MAVNPEYAAGWTAQDQNRPTVTAAHFTPEPVDNVLAPANDTEDHDQLVALLGALKTGGLMEADA